jgi:Holliday junction resolvasome RuvABC ATP-dependent DNA helicase subunit
MQTFKKAIRARENKSEPRLILLCGAPGSGKGTVERINNQTNYSNAKIKIEPRMDESKRISKLLSTLRKLMLY